MKSTGVLVVAIVLVVGAQVATAQDLSRYRAFALESSLEAVIASSGARAADVKTLHVRPAKIQQLEWRTPYGSLWGALADPVRGAAFSFYDDALYQVVVTYDRDRTSGLIDSDIIASIATVYGEPAPRSARNRPPATFPDTVLLAQWDGPVSSVTLLRGEFTPEFQLVLTSKASSARARDAIREAGRLDVIEAPRRELEERKKESADALAARDRIRTANKAAFRP